MLAENNGQRPPLREWEWTEETLPQPPAWPEAPAPGGELRSAANMISFYTAEVDGEGNMTSWNSDRPDLYTESEIAALCAEVWNSGKTSGRADMRFYRLIRREDGGQMIVLDQRLAILDARRVLRLTVLLAVAEDALLSLGAVWLIRRMIRPVDEALEKQKQFVWDASHELKTPLAVISANAEALAAGTGDGRPLQYIQSEVRRADRLIRNLLQLARMEKAGAQTARQPFDLSRAILSVALPFESAAFEAGKTLEIEVPGEIRYTGDEEMIKQLCVILLSNAEKYSDAHGTITLRLEARGDRRILRVHNTGPAIPAEAQKKIFDRFYRVDSSHNSEIPGNGLGLAIAQSIVSAHKGKIAVRSAEGEGTTFTVTL